MIPSEVTRADLGEFLRLLRTDRGLSQHELAVKLGTNRFSIMRWESGRSLPDASVYLSACTMLGCRVLVGAGALRVTHDARDPYTGDPALG